VVVRCEKGNGGEERARRNDAYEYNDALWFDVQWSTLGRSTCSYIGKEQEQNMRASEQTIISDENSRRID
jgi:hypothetical protein